MNKKIILSAAAAAVLVAGSLAGTQVFAEPELKSTAERASYTMGYNLGMNFQKQEVAIDVDALALALKDALSGAEPRLSQDEMQKAMQTLQDIQQAKMEASQAKLKGESDKVAAANLSAGVSFLEENAKKDGIQVTASGLQYKVLQAGTGPKPSRASTVDVHYRGTLLDGTEFDSSYGRNQSIQFGVTQVIPGWTEALMMMPEGSKWQVFIPSDLAYGPGGAGANIGPNATLMFDIELLQANYQAK